MIDKYIATDDDKLIMPPSENTMSVKQRAMLLNAIKSSGVFVTCGKSRPNVMSTHWGTIGSFWNRDVFVLPVRKGRLSHDIIEQTKSFAISVPIKDMRKEIIECDRLSGFGINKFDKLHLHPAKANTIPTYTISECGLFFECKVIYSADMDAIHLEDDLFKEMYNEKDFHTMYFAEIRDVYGDMEF